MKKALLATLIAWLAGSAALNIAFLWGAPLERLLENLQWIYGIFAVSVDVGVVAIPTCLLTVLLLLLLPPASALWEPRFAAATGTIAGPLEMYVWAAAVGRRLFLPNLHDGLTLLLGAVAAIVGCVFALSYALMKKQPDKSETL